MVTLPEIIHANNKWFGAENKKFFGDVDYWAVQSKTGQQYLLRSTYAWSDMFGRKRELTYRLNPLGEFLEIMPILDDVFSDKNEVDDWLEEN